jgi:tetratricopeptide (TPR) repeat protein
MFGKHHVNVIWGVILACILILGIAWFVWLRNPSPVKRNAPLNTDSTSYKHVQAETNNLNTERQYDQSASVWISYAGTTTSTNNEAQGYLNAAAAYMSAAQFNQAIAMCNKAEALKGVTFDESEIAANAYTAIGNDSKAIYYYQQAIALSPKNLIDTPGNIADFKQAIQQLQAQQAQAKS